METATIYVTFQLVLIFYMTYTAIPASVYTYQTVVNGSLVLNGCQTDKDDTINWKFQGRLFFFAGNLLQTNLTNSLHMLTNNSVYIKPISLLNIGKYECIKNQKTLSTYFVDIEVPPTLSMIVDGHSYHDNGDTIYIPYNKTIPVSCYAIGSRPSVNLFITVDNEEISRTDINTSTNTFLDGTTFDTTIQFALRTAEETGTLSCHSSGLSYYPGQRLDVSYSIYVFLESVDLALLCDKAYMPL
ncbi:uncharacterized protein [Apostichopus japonicus]|uniref:uncharacterized protein isoform X1 n=1 Tax=Stichopus japonicus TaxID=307972 RepID=UPI003AB5302C